MRHSQILQFLRFHIRNEAAAPVIFATELCVHMRLVFGNDYTIEKVTLSQVE
jgi:hypothetical protein